MPTLPAPMIAVLHAFAPLFSSRVWSHAQVLLMGAMLAPAQRTVTAALRVTGLASVRQFHRYHRVLSRATWSALAGGRVLFATVVAAFAPTGLLLYGIAEPWERRRGQRIAATGISRDPVRSSHRHFVKASGWRWICLLLLAPIPWAARTWVLTALAPSERDNRERGQRHQTLTDGARQVLLVVLLVVRRWWPERARVAVADSSYAALAFLAACGAWRDPVTVVTRLRLDAALVVTRLRLDAALSDPAPPRRPGQIGRPRRKGPRQPTLAAVVADPGAAWTAVTVAQWYGAGPRPVAVASATAVWRHGGLPPVPLRWVLIRDPKGRFATQALLGTDPDVAPAQILAWFVPRWQGELTFEEARRRLGLETQRQWSAAAIRRTTPALLGLFSLVTLLAHRQMSGPGIAVRQATW